MELIADRVEASDRECDAGGAQVPAPVATQGAVQEHAQDQVLDEVRELAQNVGIARSSAGLDPGKTAASSGIMIWAVRSPLNHSVENVQMTAAQPRTGSQRRRRPTLAPMPVS